MEDPKLIPAPVRSAVQSSGTDHASDVPVSAVSEHMITPVTPVSVWGPDQDVAFHREFLESGLDALRRLSVPDNGGESLPHWTITKYGILTCHIFSKLHVQYFLIVV